MIKHQKLIDSRLPIRSVIADCRNSLSDQGFYDYYELSQESVRADTFDNLFVVFSPRKMEFCSLWLQPIGSYVNDGFRNMTMADDHQLSLHRTNFLASNT